MSKVIITADDNGFCDHIDQAVFKAVKKGRINTLLSQVFDLWLITTGNLHLSTFF